VSIPAGAFGAGLGWSALAVLAALVVTFGCAKIAHRHNVIDTTWGLLFALIAAVTFAASAGSGDMGRRWLLLVLPVLWGLRLALHVGRRGLGKGEDPRYDDLLAKARGSRDLYAVRTVYLLQGALALLIAGPILVGAYEPDPIVGLAWAGVALWAVGLFFEAVGDAQLERFRADPANRGKVMDVGLWRYTRHPNYFGDACVWWGIFLVAAERWPGILTFPAPVLMTLLLTKGSGVRILERHMAGRPGWDEYASRTSPFVPWFPR
jgi:steroid 5-alpha reductase family enzyme